MNLRVFLLSVLLSYLIRCGFSQVFPSGCWQHIAVDSVLPGNEYGTAGFALADLDGDKDLDITVSRRHEGGRVYWYENRGSTWKQHALGIADLEQLGAVATDISNDGYPDLVMARFWFENPGVLAANPDSAWIRHVYEGGLAAENHDMAACDVNRDGRPEILGYSQQTAGGTLRVFSTANPAAWTWYNISDSVNSTAGKIPLSNGVHGGFAPCGTGDLDSDSFPDIVMPSGWYKNPGATPEGVWKFNPWPFAVGITPNLYGISTRSWVIDLDSDNDNDIVYTDCDTEGSQGYWIENTGAGRSFQRHALPSPGDSTGSFHSLAIADFDMDGDQDIFTGEQEDPDQGMKPAGLNERGFFWINTGDANHPSFMLVVLHTGNPGWHDVQAGDVEGDGDTDMVSKVWNKDGLHYHVDLWINLIIPGCIR